MPATTYAKKLMIEALINKTDMPLFTDSYVGLGSANPGDEGLFTGEVVAAGYNRIPISFGEYVTAMASDILVSWAPEGSWGLLTYAFLVDSRQGGNMLFYDSVTGVSPASGDILRIPVGNFIIY